MTKDSIDRMLEQHFAQSSANEPAVARVMAKLETLPQQQTRTRWPQILVDWQFAPAWPRVAALACCAVLGFVVGTAGIDRITMLSASAAGYDLVSFAPEALTGLRP